MTSGLALLRPFLPLAGVLLLAGCNLPQPQADTSRHFTLSGPESAAPVVGATVVRPVQLASHLRSRSMAVRVAENEVTYLDDIRWAEPLDEGITQILRTRLARIAANCTVRVQVLRCELVRPDGNRVQLTATYEIVPDAGGAGAGKSGSFTATPRPWDGKDYRVLVDSIREEVGELGEALATAVADQNLPH